MVRECEENLKRDENKTALSEDACGERPTQLSGRVDKRKWGALH